MARTDTPPYFPFYPADFAGDGLVEAISTKAVGAYLLLICKAWYENPPASIPNDDATLARWARLSADEWAECKAAVLSCWKLRHDGRWYQKRLEKEYRAVRERLKKRADAGREGANARWQSHAIAIANASQSDSSQSQKQSQTVSQDIFSQSVNRARESVNGDRLGNSNGVLADHAGRPPDNAELLRALSALAQVSIAKKNRATAERMLRTIPKPLAFINRIRTQARSQGFIGDHEARYVFKSIKSEAEGAAQ